MPSDLMLLDGSTYFLSTENGDIEVKAAEGFFHADMRHLSTLMYARDEYRRGTRIEFSEEGSFISTSAVFDLVVPARGRWQTCVDVSPIVGERVVAPRVRWTAGQRMRARACLAQRARSGSSAPCSARTTRPSPARGDKASEGLPTRPREPARASSPY